MDKQKQEKNEGGKNPKDPQGASNKPKFNPMEIAKSIIDNKLYSSILIVIIAIVIAGAVLYFQDSQSKIFIEKSEISAPLISLSPITPGPIEKVYVKVGDSVSKGERLALVGAQEIDAKTSGIITAVVNSPGQLASAQTPVISMIDTSQFRVVGHLEEDKGLDLVKVGQKVMFVLDAYPSMECTGAVDSISETPHSADIVFNISDKRQEQQFDVSAWFDVSACPGVKDGMSAKMWVYK